MFNPMSRWVLKKQAELGKDEQKEDELGKEESVEPNDDQKEEELGKEESVEPKDEHKEENPDIPELAFNLYAHGGFHAAVEGLSHDTRLGKCTGSIIQDD